MWVTFQQPWIPTDEWPTLARPVPDLDGDGVGDLVFASRWAPCLRAHSGADGRPLWRSQTPEDDGWPRPLPDGRPQPEVWSGRSDGRGAFGVEGRYRVVGRPLSARIDGDGVADLLFCGTAMTPDAKGQLTWLEAIDGRDGRTLWRTPIVPFAQWGMPLTRPSIVDVDGEPVVPWAPLQDLLTYRLADDPTRWPTDLPALAAFDAATGAERWRWPPPSTEWFGHGLPQSPEWAEPVDLNGDGADEVVVPIFESGTQAMRIGSSEVATSGLAVLDGATGRRLWLRWLYDLRTGDREVHTGFRRLTGPDLDGDGRRELVTVDAAAAPVDVDLSRERGRSPRFVVRVLVLSGRDGTIWRRWQWPLYGSGPYAVSDADIRALRDVAWGSAGRRRSAAADADDPRTGQPADAHAHAVAEQRADRTRAQRRRGRAVDGPDRRRRRRPALRRRVARPVPAAGRPQQPAAAVAQQRHRDSVGRRRRRRPRGSAGGRLHHRLGAFRGGPHAPLPDSTGGARDLSADLADRPGRQAGRRGRSGVRLGAVAVGAVGAAAALDAAPRVGHAAGGGARPDSDGVGALCAGRAGLAGTDGLPTRLGRAGGAGRSLAGPLRAPGPRARRTGRHRRAGRPRLGGRRRHGAVADRPRRSVTALADDEHAADRVRRHVGGAAQSAEPATPRASGSPSPTPSRSRNGCGVWRWRCWWSSRWPCRCRRSPG